MSLGERLHLAHRATPLPEWAWKIDALKGILTNHTYEYRRPFRATTPAHDGWRPGNPNGCAVQSCDHPQLRREDGSNTLYRRNDDGALFLRDVIGISLPGWFLHFLDDFTARELYETWLGLEVIQYKKTRG